MNFGKNVQKNREILGWSQRDLANRVGLDVSVMNRIELGNRPLKDIEIKLFADIFNISADQLLDRTIDNNFSIHPDNNLIQKYNQLSDSQQKIILTLMDEFLGCR